MKTDPGTDEEEREGRTEDKTNLRETILALDDYDKRELDNFHKELTHIKVNIGNHIWDRVLKIRLVSFLLYLAEETPITQESIRKTSYIISGFNEYEFGDEIDKVTDIAKELEESWGDIEDSIFSQWENLIELLSNYK